MKKSTLFKTLIGISVGLVFTTVNSQAQITITESDMMQIGHGYVDANDTVPTVTPGSAGASQTWDLSAIKDQYQDSVWALDPSSTPYGSDFAGSNLGLKIDERGSVLYSYGNLSSSALVTNGDAIMEAGDLIIAKVNPSATDVALPATYNSKWGGTYKEIERIAILPDSERIVSGYSYADTVDGWGTVITPVTSYSALRIIAITTQLYDSTYLYSGGVWSFVSASGPQSPTEGLTWVANGKGYPVASVNLSTPYTNSVYNAAYLKPSSLGIDELENNLSSMIYPNPASTSINIVLKASIIQNGYVKIVDITGREVANTSLKNGRTEVNTSSYSNGMYLYIITDMGGNMLDKGKFTVSH